MLTIILKTMNKKFHLNSMYHKNLKVNNNTLKKVITMSMMNLRWINEFFKLNYLNPSAREIRQMKTP